MARTINEKELSVVLKELAEPFDVSELKETDAGFPYLPVEAYRKRMDTVVGVFNYDFVLSEPVWIQVGDKMHISCVGTLTVRDDDGVSVVVKSGTGDADVITRNADGKVVKSGNDAKTASSDAFKSCCRRLGIADDQIRGERKKKNVKEGATTKTEYSNVSLYHVAVTGVFQSLGNKGYKAPAVIGDTGEVVELVLWRDGIAELEKVMELALFMEAAVNKKITFYGSRSIFTAKNKNQAPKVQIAFVRPYLHEEASHE